ncbi:MAG TPA: biotin-independent malonate decarboxylase subunit beta [Candidatus Binataceae bacterium]|nr:biotin-independent malonate decarboxylase subunit beta [Candidatus Binataceae bacterium]
MAADTIDTGEMRRFRALSWFEAGARQRISALLDQDSFVEFIGPEQRETSPHLALFNLPAAFDDGIVVGKGRLDGHQVFIAAQEGRFMGGAFGEVHGAKLVGLLRAACDAKAAVRAVLILFDTGGVRLQEANAGELAIGEVIRAIAAARAEGIAVVGLVGGRAGCFGGGGIVAGTCSRLAISEQGRIGVTGPEVIETNKGVEEFDSRDRALVWRTVGGKHRRLIGGADVFTDGSVEGFRQAAIQLIVSGPRFDLKLMQAEQARLASRLARFGDCADGREVWKKLGIQDTARVPEMPPSDFIALANSVKEANHDAR